MDKINAWFQSLSPEIWTALFAGVSALFTLFTFIAILCYVYYTYLIAKNTWIPSASFMLKQWENDPYTILFIIKNHCKISLSCWCNLNAKVCNKNVSLVGFYGGESSFDMQPFSGTTGNFNIKEILAKASYKLEDIKQMADQNNIKELLYLRIEFWYNPTGKTKLKIQNPDQPHYFDFVHKIMVTDF